LIDCLILRVFNRLKPERIEQCSMAWVRAIKDDIPREVIAIDGKTLLTGIPLFCFFPS
jgi:hypothetical protein